MQLNEIKGIKEKRLEELNSRGIFTPVDVLNYLPVKYLDMTRLVSPCDFLDGEEVLIKATAVGEPQNLFYSKVKTTKISLNCQGTKLSAMWFNQSYMKNNLKNGETYLFYGKIKIKDKRIILLSPMFEKEDKVSRLFGIFPKYNKIDGVPSKLISKIVEEILQKEELDSVIPNDLCQTTLKEGYFNAHFPTSIEKAGEGKRRILLENMTANFLANKVLNAGLTAKSHVYKDVDLVSVLEGVLPFKLYKSQIKAILELKRDMLSPTPTNRLLQGDVGSGKTVVLLAGCIMSAISGYQSAIMCPTTTLAKQHYLFIADALSKLNITCALLTGENSNDGNTLSKIANGECSVVIGTHALFSKKTAFKNLAFVGIDEQQKFGVMARANMIDKGLNVDVLTSTATPIPRTLSLITYGELNVSYCERESRISDIETYVISENKVADMYKFVEKQLKTGAVGYVVCRKIDTTEKSEEEGVEEKYKELKKVFKDYRVSLIHGRQNAAERKEQTEKFLQDKIDLLVSTSVIEVGVDNKRANIIVVFGAENFGLASLHQLRGRVGRNGQKSYCVLVCEKFSKLAKERLEYFKNNMDGFKIADYDLMTRGGGDIYGFNQHGKSFFNTQDFFSYQDVKLAKEWADEIEKRGIDEKIASKLLIKNKEIKKIALN